MQPKMSLTDLDPSSPGCCTVLRVLPVASTPTRPGVRPLPPPALLHGRQALRAGWTCLHFDVPAWTRRSPPGVQSVLVLLLIRQDRDETRTVVGVNVPEPERCRHPILQTRPGKENGPPQAQRIAQQRPRAPVARLAALLPTLGASHRAGLD